MYLFAIVNTVIFLALSLVHFYWLLGGKGGMNSVIPTVEKTTDKIFEPPAFATFIVAIGLLLFSLIELGNTGLFSSWMEVKYFHWGNLLIAFIFLARAVGDFKYVGFFKKVRNTVFAKNDSHYFAPLCLFIAITSAFIALADLGQNS